MVAPDPSGGQLRGTMQAFASQRQSALGHAASFQVEIHKKYSLAISCIVFVLIGAPVALRFPRGGIGLVIGASVAIFGFFYIGLIGGETLADRQIISPFLAMWGPNLLMTGTGLALFLRLGREQTTARGGTFSWRRRRKRRAAPAASA
jgi:lipopolysaccharide export system permease protein